MATGSLPRISTTTVTEPWDYLIVTAGNDQQAAAYERELQLRRRLGLLAGARQTLVVADRDGKRFGSGGSTILCLMEVLSREAASAPTDADPFATWLDALRRLRILILHAGGDSRSLPAYGPCGKVFIPIPGYSDSAAITTLFDRQVRTYMATPPTCAGNGQVLIAAGDVLLSFDPGDARFREDGITGLGCHALPEQASRHGVYRADDRGGVRFFLQKPSPEEQRAKGVVDRYGQSILDIGVMSFSAEVAVAMLRALGVGAAGDGRAQWLGDPYDRVVAWGLDFYREICCALGSEATAERYVASVRASGSRWDDDSLQRMFDSLQGIPFHVQALPQCRFLHFGTTRQIITSGLELLRIDRGVSRLQTYLSINNDLGVGDQIVGKDAWVEGCRVSAPLSLGGENVVVGVDVRRPLTLGPQACLDVMPGRRRDGRAAWFVRCYGVDDVFKDTVGAGATLCGRPVEEWLELMGLRPEEVWDARIPPEERTVWHAAVFPAVDDATDFTEWLWVFDPAQATEQQKQAYAEADRYSPEEIAVRTDHEAFHARRSRVRMAYIGQSLRWLFRLDSGFSSADLEHVLAGMDRGDRGRWVSRLLAEARWHYGVTEGSRGRGSFTFSRIMHTLGAALPGLSDDSRQRVREGLAGLAEALTPGDGTWLEELGLGLGEDVEMGEWSARARAVSFEHMERTIVGSGSDPTDPPRSELRTDEIVWGRAPARLDLAGGWSDTPPYSLEHGGCVINAAVDLNGQPPIHCYARVTKEPLIRIGSIDLGRRIEITELDDLLNFGSATSEFALAKAALAISGLSPSAADWPAGVSLRQMLEHFGGGIELTTLAAIPKGSGLGTSSAMGAVILAVVRRVMGSQLGRRALFHDVLRMEQALTTGGGWQDQIGSAVDGVKIVFTEPGLVPNPTIQYVPLDVLRPLGQGGTCLLYYTGITRLAKNILQQVVGRYLSRDRVALATLGRIHTLPADVAEAMAKKDLASFGETVDMAWRLNKQLDPNSSNEAVEALLDRVRSYVHGAKLLGAGGGGFLLMVCRSTDHAEALMHLLRRDPPNDLARFFDFGISHDGLVVTVC
ncbi:MAG: hypothetical protein JXQ73_27435 [Phycisphaerae bacterium]|nr:hypothetical protein [Phycisphaerae bacterium]